MKLLIVEDDLALSDVLAFTLRRAGFTVRTAHEGTAALQLWQQETPELIILDLNLPHIDGLALCRYIRARAATPILILTVRDGEDDVVAGLEAGADDYVVKPFRPQELVARVHAVLRRGAQLLSPGMLNVGGLTIDRARNELHLGEVPPVSLTPRESALLETLMLNAGRVLSTETLIAAVWGADGGSRSALKQLMYRLRAKIGSVSENAATWIETVPGLGYGLVADFPPVS